MEFLTPKEMAERAKAQTTKSYADIARDMGYSQSAVGNALRYPSTRRVKMLARILKAQGDDVKLEAHYPVQTDSDQ